MRWTSACDKLGWPVSTDPVPKEELQKAWQDDLLRFEVTSISSVSGAFSRPATWRKTLTDRNLPKISKPYLLVTFLPFHVDEDGGVWLERLWHRDLLEHLTYIENFALLGPRHTLLDFSDAVRMSDTDSKRIEFVALPEARSISAALMMLPLTIYQSWKAVGRASIVHSSVIGWPLPIGWIVNPIALMRKRFLFIVIESALWRLTPAKTPSWKERLRAQITETLASYFVNRANLTLFTQESYITSLATNPKGRSIVIPASWIDEADIIPKEHGQSFVRVPGPVRFLCPSRLTYEKGIGVLLDALRLLDEDRIHCHIGIMGSGELKTACHNMARSLSTIRLRVLDPVAYGPPFFKYIRDNDCIIIPIVSDEQPRIVFDAFSQGRPVIASDTDGLRPHVKNGVTGWLVRPNDPRLLAETMKTVIAKRGDLIHFEAATRNEAATLTHQVMHRRRWRALSDLIGS